MDTTESRRAARALVLSGSHQRRITDLERLLPLPGPPRFLPVPMWDASPVVHRFLADARRHAEARRWLAAVKAYGTAERFVQANRPAIREARRRAAEEARRATLAHRGKKGTAKRQSKAAARAKEFVQEARELLGRRPDWSLQAIAEHLGWNQPETEKKPLSARQIVRYLKAARLK